MKTKKLDKRLTLKKVTVARLEDSRMKEINGGRDTDWDSKCPSDTCAGASCDDSIRVECYPQVDPGESFYPCTYFCFTVYLC